MLNGLADTATAQEERLRILVTAQPDHTFAELRDALPMTASLATI